MTDTEEMKKEIREAFADVTFPSHLGIHAAEAMDDWIADTNELRDITKRFDYNGNWWHLPEHHISENSLGFCYLDSSGIAYYLPALMTLALDKPSFRNLNTLASVLSPPQDQDDEYVVMYEYFCNRFSQINGKRRLVCIKFMHYLKEALMRLSSFEAEEAKTIEEALAHEYWRVEQLTTRPEVDRNIKYD